MSKEKEILTYLQDNSVEIWSKIPDLREVLYSPEDDGVEFVVTKEHDGVDYEGIVPFDIVITVEVEDPTDSSVKEDPKLDMAKRYPAAAKAKDLYHHHSEEAINPFNPPKQVDKKALDAFKKRHQGVKIK